MAHDFLLLQRAEDFSDQQENNQEPVMGRGSERLPATELPSRMCSVAPSAE
jgi:hypothetical protein